MKPKIFIISGKARHGKDTIAGIIEKYYQNSIKLHYAYYLKEYAKKIKNWDGLESTKPRRFLQQLSLDVIRKQIGSNFFTRRMEEDIKVYSNFFNVIVIPDARRKEELDYIKSRFDNVITIRINRNNFISPLTLEEQKDITEVDLDDYKNFDYVIENDGTLEDLKNKIENILNKLEGE